MRYCARKNGRHPTAQSLRAVHRFPRHRRAFVRRGDAVGASHDGRGAPLAHTGGLRRDRRLVPVPPRAEHRQRLDRARQALVRRHGIDRRVPRPDGAALHLGDGARRAVSGMGVESDGARRGHRRRRHRRGPFHGHRDQARPCDRAPAGGSDARRGLLPRGGSGTRLHAARAADLGGDRRVLRAARLAVILLDLAVTFGVLSLIAFRGMPAVMPEMQRLVVEVKAWTTESEFIQLFAIAQAAPGPNVLIVSLIGWKAAGLPGPIVALLAVCAPAAVLSWWIADLWERFKDSPWRIAIQKAIAPLVVGLTLSGGYVLCTPSTPDWRLWAIAAASAVAFLTVKINPLWILAAGGMIGGALLGGSYEVMNGTLLLR